ncbi:SAF domain-containing protein [Pseudactinotalea sp. Z1748]|uniref:SAF domain-containing protein n=1 Tax=Pseudactinotalea sp. Z1748 TaxID=3413027 RepID=UPI003C7B4755
MLEQRSESPRTKLPRRKRAREAERSKVRQRPVPRRRSAAMIALALALLAGTTLAFNHLLSSASETSPVLVVSSHIARGEAITADHLQVAELPQETSLESVPADEMAGVVGQVAAVGLVPGATLSPGGFTTTLAPEEGSAFVGVALDSSQMPAHTLVAGDQVRIVDTPGSQSDPPLESPHAILATVLSVTELEGTGVKVVDLEVGADEAPGLAARAATGRVALVLDAAGES